MTDEWLWGVERLMEFPKTCNSELNSDNLWGIGCGAILRTVTRRKGNWTGYILRRDRLLKPVIGWKLEVTGGRGGRRKQLLHDLKEKRGYWKLEEETLDRTVWGTTLWRRLWTCKKTDHVVVMMMLMDDYALLLLLLLLLIRLRLLLLLLLLLRTYDCEWIITRRCC